MHSVQEKLWFFFIIHCNPYLTYISLQEIFKALNAMPVYSHSYWVANFLYNQLQPSACEGKGGKIMKILGNSTIFLGSIREFFSKYTIRLHLTLKYTIPVRSVRVFVPIRVEYGYYIPVHLCQQTIKASSKHTLSEIACHL